MQNIDSIPKAAMTFTIQNNTDITLTDVTISIPSIGLGYFGLPPVKQKGSNRWSSADTLFSLENIKARSTALATVSAFSQTPKTYSVRGWITTREGFAASTNSVVLTIQ